MTNHRTFFIILLLAVLGLTAGYRSSHPPEVELAMLGDVMLGRGVAQVHAAGDWDTCLAAAAPALRHADLAFANLESPLTEYPLLRLAYDLRAPADSTEALTSAGLDLLGLANNHSLDAGERGSADTRAALLLSGLTPIGPGLDPVYVSARGYRIAFLADDDVTQPVDAARLLDGIREIRPQVDFIVLSIHWGIEYSSGPTQRERDLAAELITAGVDLIVGHHPHVLQATEWITPPGEDRRGFVAYSLGNALFDQPSPPSVRESAVLVVRLGPGGVRNVDTIPIVIDFNAGAITPASNNAIENILRRLSLTPPQ